MKQYGLIGHPLVQSFSKIYFDEKFTKENINAASFHLFDISNIEELITVLKEHPHLKGFAVTIPYKQSIIKYLDAISDEAKKIGAVNCVQINNGKLKGYNTDIVGFAASFLPMLTHSENKALVLGTGGASKAVQYVLSQNKIPFQLVSRQSSKECIDYENITKEKLDQYNIVINCTPLGMVPNETTYPTIPYQFVTAQHIFYDLVYKPAETVFLKKAKEQGASALNGFDMLIGQAEENWKIWNS